jgi:hypothetical protein
VTRSLIWSAALIALLTLVVGIGTGWAADLGSGSTPTISSDKGDYAPGDSVVLTGGGWQAGEPVQIDVEDSAGKTWSHEVTVTADEGGSIRDEFNLPEWFVATYSVTATGETSGIDLVHRRQRLRQEREHDSGRGGGPVQARKLEQRFRLPGENRPVAKLHLHDHGFRGSLGQPGQR